MSAQHTPVAEETNKTSVSHGRVLECCTFKTKREHTPIEHKHEFASSDPGESESNTMHVNKPVSVRMRSARGKFTVTCVYMWACESCERRWTYSMLAPGAGKHVTIGTGEMRRDRQEDPYLGFNCHTHTHTRPEAPFVLQRTHTWNILFWYTIIRLSLWRTSDWGSVCECSGMDVLNWFE